MNARIVFVFGLLFTLLNVVMAFTTHEGLFMMAIVGLMVMMGAASKIWPDVVRANTTWNDTYDHTYWEHDIHSSD